LSISWRKLARLGADLGSTALEVAADPLARTTGRLFEEDFRFMTWPLAGD
jgi:hypothetical protein